MASYNKATLVRAKALRREMTQAERRLWSVCRNAGLAGAKFRRQQPIGPFIVDFVCHQARLVIEADGGQHSDCESDARRTAFLEGKGYRVLRFWNNDILENLQGVAEIILEALATPHPAQAAPESPSPSRGEGLGACHGY